MAAWKVNCYLKSRLGEKNDYEGGTSGTYGAHCGSKRHPGTSRNAVPPRGPKGSRRVLPRGPRVRSPHDPRSRFQIIPNESRFELQTH